jgi:pimeloyl-ACP methyl ester carboxylesterase
MLLYRTSGEERIMADIMLVHGAMHGAWCWDLLRPALERLGHRTHAIDLDIETPGTTLDSYADEVAAALDRLPGPAWLVGHSMGGMVTPRAALKRPVAGLILLCSVPPSADDAEQQENLAAVNLQKVGEFVHEGGLQSLPPNLAVEHFFAACPPDLQRWASHKLRPQSAAAFENRTAMTRWPDVPTHAILTRDDAMLFAEPMAALFRRRLGLEPVMLPGDHSPFLGCPEPLADAIDLMVGGGR